MKESWKSALEEREQNGLTRGLSIREVDTDYLNLSGNNYLNLSHNSAVIQSAKEAPDQHGASSTGSPLVSGYTKLHQDLENLISEWYYGRPVLLWNTGYSANQAILSTYPEKGDLVLADRLIHNSMISGILKSGARLKRYSHLDLEELEALLEKNAHLYSQVYLVTESVFSMDGDYPDLSKIADLKDKYSFTWILDEAHAIGWYGEKGAGLAEEFGVLDKVDIIVGTMGKAIGSMGAFTVFKNFDERSYFINFGSELIYSTYLAPPSVGASMAAIQYIQRDSNRSRYQILSESFRDEIKNARPEYLVGEGCSPIIPIIIGDVKLCMKISSFLSESGIEVGSIRPPTVPSNTSRIRVSIHSDLSVEERARFIEAYKAG